jgi:uncharacterized protein (DUF1800 family)
MEKARNSQQNGGGRIFLPVTAHGVEAQARPTPTPTPTPGPGITPTPSGTTEPPPPLTSAEAVRFLAQAGWGATPEDINPLVQSGFNAWITAQKNQPVSLMRPYLEQIRADIKTNDPLAANVPYQRADAVDFALSHNIATVWMRNLINGGDQLRQRVAWALSQIMVVSFQSVQNLNRNAVTLADYYDTLARHALGNFKDLLKAVSVHPAMAFFLSSLGNDKPDPANNQLPDENYAREVMQLFTIGLWELNPDGEQRKDSTGNPIPTYDNADIEELARVFTGLWFQGKLWPGQNQGMGVEWLTDFPVAMFEDHHDRGAKKLFHGKAWETTLPAGVNGMADIDAAITVLVNHPNTAPFISKALIKFLVTSNPSPAYVRRVAAVFANNGSGVRGDLFATVRAILLDTEARSLPARANPRHGKLQEPLVRTARMVRAFKAGRGLTDLQWWGTLKGIQFMQWPLYSPSVFNFFSPNYRHLGVLARNGLTSPEFQILNSVTVATMNNQFAAWTDTLLHGRLAGGTPEFKFDFTSELALTDTPELLVDRVSLLLCQNQMAAATRAKIIEGIGRVPSDNRLGRVRLAVYLAAVAPEGAILR